MIGLAVQCNGIELHSGGIEWHRGALRCEGIESFDRRSNGKVGRGMVLNCDGKEKNSVALELRYIECNGEEQLRNAMARK